MTKFFLLFFVGVFLTFVVMSQELKKVEKIYIHQHKKIKAIYYQEMSRCFFSIQNTQYRLVTEREQASQILTLSLKNKKGQISIGNKTTSFAWPQKEADRQKVIRFNTYKLLHGEDNLRLISQKDWFQSNLKPLKVIKQVSKNKLKAQNQLDKKEPKIELNQQTQASKIQPDMSLGENKLDPENNSLISWKDISLSIYFKQVFKSVKSIEFEDTNQNAIEVAIGAKYQNVHLFYARRFMAVVEDKKKVYSQQIDSLRFRHSPLFFQKYVPTSLAPHLVIGYTLAAGSLEETVRGVQADKLYRAASIDLTVNKLFLFQIGWEMTNSEDSAYLSLALGYNL